MERKITYSLSTGHKWSPKGAPEKQRTEVRGKRLRNQLGSDVQGDEMRSTQSHLTR